MAERESLRVWSKDAKEYRLVARQHSGFSKDGSSREEFKTGDKVMLEPNEYAAFADKFEPLKRDSDFDPNPQVTPTQPQQPIGATQDSAPSADPDSSDPASGHDGAGGGNTNPPPSQQPGKDAKSQTTPAPGANNQPTQANLKPAGTAPTGQGTK